MAPTVISYRSASTQGALQSVDFSSVAGKNYAFFQLYDHAGLEAVRRLMEAPPLSQETVAVTNVGGKPMLVMRNHVSPFAILEALKARGETLELVHEKKPFDAWKVRSMLGFGGQTLQLISSFLRPTRQIDTSVFVFAASNLAANSINLVYEGEKVEDTHQLRYLKQRVNRELSPHLNAGQAAFSVEDHRAVLRDHDEHSHPMDEAKGFMKRHSVQVGELGLRVFGAIGLAFPARYWKTGWQEKRLPQMDSSKLRRYTGLSSIFGKSVAFTSKIEDPYNPKPATWLDTLREKYAFLGGGLIEATSFSALAYDCFFNSTGAKDSANWKRGMMINGTHHRDWLGGIGATMFVLGYIVRSWAKFGEREVDMKELYAHASDTLAHTPPEKMPQLLANTAASLAEHFEPSSGLRFSTIYTNLISDLSKYHAATQQPVVGHPNAAVGIKSKGLTLQPPEKPGHRVSQAHLAMATLAPMVAASR